MNRDLRPLEVPGGNAVNPAQWIQEGSYDRAVGLRVKGVLKIGSSHRRRFPWAG